MDWLNINVLYFQNFIIVYSRIVTMVALAPLIGASSIKAPVKAGFAFMICLVIFPVIVNDMPPIPENNILFFGLMIRESLVGMLMGVVCSLIFSAVQLSGQIFGMQIGFGIVNVIDPLSDLQISLLGQFQFMVAIFLFFAVNGHHLLLLAMTNSYHFVPVNTFSFTDSLSQEFSLLLGKMYTIAFKVGFPMIAAIFLLKVIMGIIARTVPQMNVFIVGLPLNIFVGLLVMGLSIVYVTYVIKLYFVQIFRDLMILYKLSSGI